MNRALSILFVALMVTSLFAGTAVAQTTEQRTIEVGDLIESDSEIRSTDSDIIEVRNGTGVAVDTGRVDVRFIGDQTVNYIVEESDPNDLVLNTSDVYVDERSPYNVTAIYTNGSYTVERDVSRVSTVTSGGLLTVNSREQELVGETPGTINVTAELGDTVTEQQFEVESESFTLEDGESLSDIVVVIEGNGTIVDTVELNKTGLSDGYEETINVDGDFQQGDVLFYGRSNTRGPNGEVLDQPILAVNGDDLSPRPEVDSTEVGYGETISPNFTNATFDEYSITGLEGVSAPTSETGVYHDKNITFTTPELSQSETVTLNFWDKGVNYAGTTRYTDDEGTVKDEVWESYATVTQGPGSASLNTSTGNYTATYGAGESISAGQEVSFEIRDFEVTELGAYDIPLSEPEIAGYVGMGIGESYTINGSYEAIDRTGDLRVENTGTDVTTDGWVVVNGTYQDVTSNESYVYITESGSAQDVEGEYVINEGTITGTTTERSSAPTYTTSVNSSTINLSLDVPSGESGVLTDSEENYTQTGEHYLYNSSVVVNDTEFTSQTENFSESYDRNNVFVNGTTLEASDSGGSSGPTIDGTGTPTQPAGSGSSSDPYQVTTVNELAYMDTDPPSVYHLQNDLVFPDPADTGLYGSSGWSPMLIDDPGTLDGQGYSMTNFFINRSSTYLQGLFSEYEGTAKNFQIHGDVTTGQQSGMVAAESYGTISNVSVHGSVSGGEEMGGVVGINSGTVSNVYSDANVTLSAESQGGLVGYNSDTLEKSVYTGSMGSSTTSYQGADVGYDLGTITDVYYNSDNVDLSGKGTALNTSEMTGSDASTNMNLDFSNTWEETVDTDEDVSSDSYPILTSVDRKSQLQALGVYSDPSYWIGAYDAPAADNPSGSYNVSVPETRSAELRISPITPTGSEQTLSAGENVTLSNETFYVRWDLDAGETVDAHTVEGNYERPPLDDPQVYVNGSQVSSSFSGGTYEGLLTVNSIINDQATVEDTVELDYNVTYSILVDGTLFDDQIAGTITGTDGVSNPTVTVGDLSNTVSGTYVDGEFVEVPLGDLGQGDYTVDVTADGSTPRYVNTTGDGQLYPADTNTVEVFSNQPENITIEAKTMGFNESQDPTVELVYPSGRTEQITGYDLFLVDGPAEIQRQQIVSQGEAGQVTVEAEVVEGGQVFTNTTTLEVSERTEVTSPRGALEFLSETSFWVVFLTLVLVPIFERFRRYGGWVGALIALTSASLFGILTIWPVMIVGVIGLFDMFSRSGS